MLKLSELSRGVIHQIVTGKFPFEELKHDAPIISRVVKGELPAIRDDAQLSQIGMLCSLMSDSWLSKPAKRINASTFHRKLSYLVSASTHYIGAAKQTSN